MFDEKKELGMQIIGIYINDGDPRVLKNLSPGWYPFGDFPNCHEITNSQTIEEKIKSNQKFIHQLYRLNNSDKETKINLSCIVGKNGSGKSTLLDIYYRIINNFTCKIKKVLQKSNSDYSPIWATGINAELYFENNDILLCIKVDSNKPFLFDEKRSVGTVSFFDCQKPKIDLFEEKTEDELRDLIGKNGFYTIATNYSLYTNSVVSGKLENQDKEESWLENLYHKNDGYFTPIVLVPFKDGRSVDYLKEKKLAEERVSVLSLLMHAKNNSDFIENYLPEKIKYKLQETRKYKKRIDDKYTELIKTLKSKKKKNKISVSKAKILRSDIYKIWQDELNKPKYQSLSVSIKENLLNYLTYKTIKVCINYESFSKRINEAFGLSYYMTEPVATIGKIKDEIIPDLCDIEKKNYANLKILQCLQFLGNQDFYLKENKNKVTVKAFLEKFSDVKTYDDIYVNLPPPFFFKEFYYSKKVSKKKLPEKTSFRLSEMSSGEEQLLFSLSYMIYHMKNVESNENLSERIEYKNFNLIFDEAELYYHPEYQRKFIYNLLKILNRSHLKTDSINITLVTHSPFMLSDIPGSNVLCLENGQVNKKAMKKTLCANFYDLLKNQFFMKSSVGAVTEEKINNIISKYEESQEEESQKEKFKIEDSDYKFYQEFVKEIDDKYLHETLNSMLEEIDKKRDPKK